MPWGNLDPGEGFPRGSIAVLAMALLLAPALSVLPGCIGLAGLSLALLRMHANMHRLLPHV